jgi:hypothetical protein
MEEKKLEKLQKKISKEFNEFLEEMVKLDKEGLGEKSYEIGWKAEMDCLVQNGAIWDEEMIKVLLDSKNALHTLYDYWLKFETSGVDSDLEYFTSEFLSERLVA